MTPKWPQKSVKKSLKAEHCVLKALANGHPFSERVASETICRGWLRAHPSLFFSVPVPFSSSFAPALPLYCLMFTHVNPSVAVCEQKSGQIWPQKGPLVYHKQANLYVHQVPPSPRGGEGLKNKFPNAPKLDTTHHLLTA